MPKLNQNKENKIKKPKQKRQKGEYLSHLPGLHCVGPTLLAQPISLPCLLPAHARRTGARVADARRHAHGHLLLAALPWPSLLKPRHPLDPLWLSQRLFSPLAPLHLAPERTAVRRRAPPQPLPPPRPLELTKSSAASSSTSTPSRATPDAPQRRLCPRLQPRAPEIATADSTPPSRPRAR